MTAMQTTRRLLRRHHRARFDRDSLAGDLSPITYQPDPDDQQQFEQAGLGRALPLLLGLDQDQEFALCRDTARHRLGFEPDPDALPI